MKHFFILIWLAITTHGLLAQEGDSASIVVIDKGAGVKIKTGDSTYTFSNDSLYQYFLDEGLRLASEENYTGAIAKFQTALLYLNTDPEVYYYIGLALYYLDQLDEALEYINHTILLNPEHYHALNMAGIINSKKDNEEEAVRYFEKACKIKPDNPEAYYNLAVAYLNFFQDEKACFYLEKAKELGSTKAEQLINEYCL